GGVEPGADIRRHRNPRLVQHFFADRDPLAILVIKSLALHQVDQPAGKPRLLLWIDRSAGRKLQRVETKLVNGGSALVDDLAYRTRTGDRIERRNRAEIAALCIDPHAEDPLLLAHSDRPRRPFHDYRNI